MNNGIVRTTMAAAFVAACSSEELRGRRLNRASTRVVNRVLTNKANGVVGVKYDPAWSKKKQPKPKARGIVLDARNGRADDEPQHPVGRGAGV